MSAFSKLFKAIGLGQFGDNSHPIHPSTIHFPIAFLSLSYGLDALYGATVHTKFALTRSVVPYLADISKASYFSNILGVVTAAPAALTGVAELYAMWQGQGAFQEIRKESTGETVYSGTNPKVRIGFIHGVLNDICILISVYNWWSRRNAPGYIPSNTNIALSTLMLPGLMFSAYLGGAMVYKYGVGVMRMGEAARIKEDMQKDEVKRMDGQTQIVDRKGQ